MTAEGVWEGESAVATLTIGATVNAGHDGVVGDEKRLALNVDQLMPLDGPTRWIVAVGPAKVIRRHEARVGEFGVQQGSGVVENRLIVGGSINCPTFDAFVNSCSVRRVLWCRHVSNSTRHRRCSGTGEVA